MMFREPEAGRVLSAVEAQGGVIDRTMAFVQEHPELGHEEHRCAGYLVQELSGAGLRVEEGIAGLDTAFRATVEGAHPGPTVGVVVLYDAVPVLDVNGDFVPMHACGHGSIAGGVIGAALALATLRDDLPGRVVVIGCPADEIHAPGTIARGGGKALTADAGAWDDVDVALYAHPEYIDTVTLASKWMRRERLLVTGERGLRAGVNDEPVEALEKVLAATASRPPEHVRIESAVLDGDLEQGGGLRFAGDLLFIGDSEEDVDAWVADFRTALPTGRWHGRAKIPGIRQHPRVTELVAEALASAGRGFEPDPPMLPFATDFGVVSRRVPAAALIGIGSDEAWAFHSARGAEQFAGRAGHQAARDLAGVVAVSCIKILCGWAAADDD